MSSRWRKLRAMFVLTFFAERGIEPNDIALPIPAGSLCFMRRVFQLMAEVAVA